MRGAAKDHGLVVRTAIASLTLVALAWPCQAQVLTERSVSLAMARAMADAASAACKASGYDINVAVVDRAGTLKLLFKADGANPHNAEVARRKAYTARTFGVPSSAFAKRSVDALAGQRLVADVLPLGGGVPVKLGSETIGALGVSGAPNQDEDEKCALAGIKAVAGQLGPAG